MQSLFIVGDFREDRLGASYRRAFLEVGTEVECFDLAKALDCLAWPGRNRILHRMTVRSLRARRAWSRGLNSQLVQSARSSRSDWVLVLNGEWVMPETVQSLKQLGKRVAIFHADNPFPPYPNNRPETLETARQADLYLTWSERLVQSLQAVGVPRAAFLAFGWDQKVFPYQCEVPQGSWPGVLFIGGWDREREEFLDLVAAHVPLRIYGPDYWGTRTRPFSRARRCWMGTALHMSVAARAIREAAICLNILRSQHVIDGEPDGLLMRNFEVPGAGGFLLSTRSGSANRLFPERAIASYFNDSSECIEMCKHYMAAGDERRLLVRRGHAEVASRHTYAHRARELIAMFSALNESKLHQRLA